MRSWDEFEIGKQYCMKDWTPEKFITCVGKRLNGVPILEQDNALFDPGSWNSGDHPRNWRQFARLRHFWISEFDQIYYNPADAPSNEVIIHVVEVRED